jgi:ATP-dependent DNA ligase
MPLPQAIGHGFVYVEYLKIWASVDSGPTRRPGPPDLPLIERKRLVRGIIPAQPSAVLYVDHIAGNGVQLFDAVCARDLECMVAKLANAPYTPEATTWVKIKNPAYSQAERRADFFDVRAARA